MPKIFEEWKVDKGEKIRLLRVVSIDDEDAKMLNGDAHRTSLMYFLKPEAKPEVKPEVDEAKAHRAELFEKLRAAGITVPKNTLTNVLEAKVAEL
jgi:hypothetical protein